MKVARILRYPGPPTLIGLGLGFASKPFPGLFVRFLGEVPVSGPVSLSFLSPFTLEIPGWNQNLSLFLLALSPSRLCPSTSILFSAPFFHKIIVCFNIKLLQLKFKNVQFVLDACLDMIIAKVSFCRKWKIKLY